MSNTIKGMSSIPISRGRDTIDSYSPYQAQLSERGANYNSNKLLACNDHIGCVLTHVCKRRECFKGLCERCIKSHNEYHKGRQEYPEIERLEDVKQHCEGMLEESKAQYKQMQQWLQTQLNEKQEYINQFSNQHQKVDDIQKQISEVCATYFSNLKAEIASSSDNLNSTQEKISKIAQHIEGNQRRTEEIAAHVNSGKFDMKIAQELLSKNINQEIDEIKRNVMQEIAKADKSKPNVNIDFFNVQQKIIEACDQICKSPSVPLQQYQQQQQQPSYQLQKQPQLFYSSPVNSIETKYPNSIQWQENTPQEKEYRSNRLNSDSATSPNSIRTDSLYKPRSKSPLIAVVTNRLTNKTNLTSPSDELKSQSLNSQSSISKKVNLKVFDVKPNTHSSQNRNQAQPFSSLQSYQQQLLLQQQEQLQQQQQFSQKQPSTLPYQDQRSTPTSYQQSQVPISQPYQPQSYYPPQIQSQNQYPQQQSQYIEKVEQYPYHKDENQFLPDQHLSKIPISNVGEFRPITSHNMREAQPSNLQTDNQQRMLSKYERVPDYPEDATDIKSFQQNILLPQSERHNSQSKDRFNNIQIDIPQDPRASSNFGNQVDPQANNNMNSKINHPLDNFKQSKIQSNNPPSNQTSSFPIRNQSGFPQNNLNAIVNEMPQNYNPNELNWQQNTKDPQNNVEIISQQTPRSQSRLPQQQIKNNSLSPLDRSRKESQEQIRGPLHQESQRLAQKQLSLSQMKSRGESPLQNQLSQFGTKTNASNFPQQPFFSSSRLQQQSQEQLNKPFNSQIAEDQSKIKNINNNINDSFNDGINIQVPDWFQENSNTKYLHFFQPKSSLLHLMSLEDLKESQKENKQRISTQNNSRISNVRSKQLKFYKCNLLDEQGQSFQVPRFHKSVTLQDGTIYLVGGMSADQKLSNQAFLYEFSSNKLFKIASMNYGRSGFGCLYSCTNHSIYVVGGACDSKGQGSEVSNKCEKFDIQSNKWVNISSLTEVCFNPAICTYQQSSTSPSYILKFGGKISDNTISSQIERYHIKQDKWETINLKNQRQLISVSSASAYQFNNYQIIIFGGSQQNNGGSHINSGGSYINNGNSHINSGSQYNQRGQQQNQQIGNSYIFEPESMTVKNGPDLPFFEGFSNQLIISSENILYTLQNISEPSKSEIIFLDKKRIISLDQSGWKVLNQ